MASHKRCTAMLAKVANESSSMEWRVDADRVAGADASGKELMALVSQVVHGHSCPTH
jgi:phosphotransferase system HPr-like phosphotransfer protein